MDSLDKSAIDAVAELAREGVTPFEVNGVTVAAVPTGSRIEWLDKYQPDRPPKRKEAAPYFMDAASFIDYYRLFSDEGSRIFADPTHFSVAAILDYHLVGSDTPARHKKHTAHFQIRPTVEWETWVNSNGKRKTQLEFAEFIENNSGDIFQPAAADMMSIARELEATKEVTFASAVRTDNGQTQFTYNEETRAKVGRAKVEVPEYFILRLRAFVGTAPVQATARLRYRLAEGKLTMWYDLLRPHTITEQAFESIVREIREKTGTPVLIGRP